MPTKVPDPLLCLTVSATLREKPLAFTAARQSLLALIEAAGGLPDVREPATPLTIRVNGEDDDQKADITGLEEVNLLEGLTLNPTFASNPLRLPSTRLAPSVRKQSYALPLQLIHRRLLRQRNQRIRLPGPLLSHMLPYASRSVRPCGRSQASKFECGQCLFLITC